MRPTEAGRLTVYRGAEPVAELLRSSGGCELRHLPSGRAQSLVPPGVGFLLPPQDSPERWNGDNLPPFFANLLPEGLRLAALVGRVRTSPDDLFSMLAAVGADCVGDVSAVAPGSGPPKDVSEVEGRPEGMDFRKVEETLRMAAEMAGIQGVQAKLSAGRLTLPAARRSILKVEPEGYPGLAANEHACLELARKTGFAVPKAGLVRDANGHPGLAVARFDRTAKGGRVHVEDACQFTGRYPADKYRLSMREVAEAMAPHVASAKVEVRRLVSRYAFSYLVGNADLHAKNISLWVNPTTGLVEQSPVYDVCCTLVFPRLEPHMALKLDGKDDNFRLADFTDFAGRFGVLPEAVEGQVAKILAATQAWPERVAGFAPTPKDARRADGILRKRWNTLAASMP